MTHLPAPTYASWWLCGCYFMTNAHSRSICEPKCRMCRNRGRVTNPWSSPSSVQETSEFNVLFKEAIENSLKVSPLTYDPQNWVSATSAIQKDAIHSINRVSTKRSSIWIFSMLTVTRCFLRSHIYSFGVMSMKNSSNHVVFHLNRVIKMRCKLAVWKGTHTLTIQLMPCGPCW